VGIWVGRDLLFACDPADCVVPQAVIRCAGLRLSLVRLGADAESPATGPQLVEMLAEPTSSGLEAGLLELLSPAQLGGVLMVEADTYEQHLRNLQGMMQQRRAMQQGWT
jgi:hypothetical protein